MGVQVAQILPTCSLKISLLVGEQECGSPKTAETDHRQKELGFYLESGANSSLGVHS